MREQAFDFLEWLWGFPGDSVVKNLPASARDSGSIPGPGIPHVPQLLKPKGLKPVLCSNKSHHNQKPMHCNEEEPPLTATREKPSKQQTPNIVINK